MKNQTLSFFIMNLLTNKKFLFLLIIFLLSLNIWKVTELTKCRKHISLLHDKFFLSEKRWIKNLYQNALIYNNYSNSKSFIKEITENRLPLLIYRYSKNTCESCIQEDLEEINLLKKEFGNNKILLLPTYPNDRDGSIELSNILASFNYVNIPFDSLFIPSQDGNFQQRYFAVIDKELNLTMVFFPLKGENILTRLYFSEIKKILKD